jgi:Domain of unknown function (DUF397)
MLARAGAGLSATMPSVLCICKCCRARHCNPGGNCVEMAELLAGSVAVRNSRIPDGPALIFTRAGWRLSVVVPCQAGHPRGPGKVIVS